MKALERIRYARERGVPLPGVEKALRAWVSAAGTGRGTVHLHQSCWLERGRKRETEVTLETVAARLCEGCADPALRELVGHELVADLKVLLEAERALERSEAPGPSTAATLSTVRTLRLVRSSLAYAACTQKPTTSLVEEAVERIEERVALLEAQLVGAERRAELLQGAATLRAAARTERSADEEDARDRLGASLHGVTRSSSKTERVVRNLHKGWTEKRRKGLDVPTVLAHLTTQLERTLSVPVSEGTADALRALVAAWEAAAAEEASRPEELIAVDAAPVAWARPEVQAVLAAHGPGRVLAVPGAVAWLVSGRDVQRLGLRRKEDTDVVLETAGGLWNPVRTRNPKDADELSDGVKALEAARRLHAG